MMKIPHSPHHWIPVTLVIAAGLLALTEAHGQQQGTDGAQVSISRGPNAVITPRRDVDVAPKKDNSLGNDERSAVKKTKKAAKRMINRKHGIPPIEGTSGSSVKSAMTR